MSIEIPLEKSLDTRHSLLRAVGRLILAVGDLYAIALALFLLAKLLIGERWELIALIDSFLHLLALPMLIWFPMRLLQRRWIMAVVAGLPVVFFVVAYGKMFIPRLNGRPASPANLKVLTYNIHSEEQALEPMIALIRDSGADIVALQELSTVAAKRFTDDLSTIYPYQALHATPGEPVIGQGILSRFPIKADDYWRNTSLPVSLAHQRVQIEINGTSLALYNAHPIHPFLKDGHLFFVDLRRQEIESVLSRAGRDKTPLLIVGDFNMSDQSADYQRITALYTDTYREVGWGLGLTFPDFSRANAVPGGMRSLPFPQLVRLDYLFHNADMRAIDVRVWPSSGGSDHRPVIASFGLPTR